MTATITEIEDAFERSLMQRFHGAESVLKAVSAQYRAGRISEGQLMQAVAHFETYGAGLIDELDRFEANQKERTQ